MKQHCKRSRKRVKLYLISLSVQKCKQYELNDIVLLLALKKTFKRENGTAETDSYVLYPNDLSVS